MSAMWDALRDVAASRFRARAEFWRKKAREDLNVHPDTALHYATEADTCADIIETLRESYEAPPEPMLRSERRPKRA